MLAGMLSSLQQLLVPAVFDDVVEHGAAGVGAVGDVALAAGQVPDQPGVDGAEGELALLGLRARALATLSRIQAILVAEK